MQACWAEETSLKKTVQILLFKNLWLVVYIIYIYLFISVVVGHLDQKNATADFCPSPAPIAL